MRKFLLSLLLMIPLLSTSQVNEPIITHTETKNYISDEDVIQLINNYGDIYEINVKINNVLDIPFILDTGASESSMPTYVLNTLIRTNTVFKVDRLEDKTYIMADGTTTVNRRILIRKLKIGNNEVENIAFSISDDLNSPLLIGQNVLSLFTEVKINYKDSTITFIK